MLQTTIGQLAINDLLPEDLRDNARIYDKKAITALFQEIEQKYPEKYKDIAAHLMDLGQNVATSYGRSASFSLKDLQPPEGRDKLVNELRAKLKVVVDNPKLTSEARNAQIVKLVSAMQEPLRTLNMEEGKRTNNPFALQVISGARGNPSQFSSLRVGDLLVADHNDNPIPIPMLHSYAEGLDPVEYWAAAYGARKAAWDLQSGTPKSGFFGKEMALGSHRLIVTERDCGTENGLPVKTDDPDNEGALLARAYGKYKQDTPITPSMIKELAKQHETILVRSPITCQSENGICAKCSGFRERGDLPNLGDNVGVTSATAISEPMTQIALSSKHSGGVAGSMRKATSFDTLKRLVEIPETFAESSPVARLDGLVESIEKAPQGGHYVTINKEQHYVPEDQELVVKPGTSLEAGDALSDGITNPSEVVKYKGIGEGRRQFVNEFRNLTNGINVHVHRRNLETIARGMINHVRVTDLDGADDGLPGDIREFDTMTRNYEPRHGAKTVPVTAAMNHYLEKPVNQYSIGTRMTPRIAKELKGFGVKEVTVHPDPPSFEPEMRRAMETLSYAPDWMTRLGGWQLKRGLLDAAQHGATSDTKGISFIPALAQGTTFGENKPGEGY